MLSLIFSPQEVGKHIAKRAKAKRLSLNFSQKTVAERSGISLSALKKFESSGKLSLESLLKLALALGCLQDFETLFTLTPGLTTGSQLLLPYSQNYGNLLEPTNVSLLTSMDDLFKDKKRKRGRQ